MKIRKEVQYRCWLEEPSVLKIPASGTVFRGGDRQTPHQSPRVSSPNLKEVRKIRAVIRNTREMLYETEIKSPALLQILQPLGLIQLSDNEYAFSAWVPLRASVLSLNTTQIFHLKTLVMGFPWVKMYSLKKFQNSYQGMGWHFYTDQTSIRQ